MIELTELKKSYRSGPGADVHALRGVTLTIGKGDFVAIMGPSGCGKSTLMNILGTLDRADSGSYRLLGQEVAAMDDAAQSLLRNRRIGFVFQSFNLLPLASALENVALPLLYSPAPGDAHKRSLAALELVGLAARAHHRPGELSGGQQQRVAIARALVNDPDLILADEPTGNLDTRASAEVMAVLEGLANQGKTVILVTHEPDIAAFTRRVIGLRDGQVQFDAPPAEPKSARQELDRLDKEAQP